MGILTLWALFAPAVYAVYRWWQWSTVLPAGYRMITRDDRYGVYRWWSLIGPDTVEVARSRDVDIWGIQKEYRRMVRIANVHAKSNGGSSNE